MIPTAVYTSPNDSTPVEFRPNGGSYTTEGETTKISDVVIRAGGEDRDRPSPASNTPLGELRAQLTNVQDQINVFLTERMAVAKEKDAAGDIERRLLDEGHDEDLD